MWVFKNYLEKTITFSSNPKLVGTLVYPKKNFNPPGVLMIHGGGLTGARTIYKNWQKFLARNGFSSFAFDCRGNGDSEGEFADSTLDNRLKDSLEALEEFKNSHHVNPENIVVVGTSMGGHTASRLIDKKPELKALILNSAAAYSIEAEDKKHDGEFTEVIRKQNSWKNSPAFESVSNFKGDVLVVYAENDLVIPKEIQNKYKDQITDRSQAVIIPNIGHRFLKEENKQQKKLQKLYLKSLYIF